MFFVMLVETSNETSRCFLWRQIQQLCRISKIQRSHIVCLPSYYPTSINNLRIYSQILTFLAICYKYQIRFLYGIPYMVYNVLYIMYGFCMCMIYNVWHVLYGVWLILYEHGICHMPIFTDFCIFNMIDFFGHQN